MCLAEFFPQGTRNLDAYFLIKIEIMDYQVQQIAVQILALRY